MEAVVAALAAQQDELALLLGPLSSADLELPSRCPGWSVADVVLHLAQTNEMAVASTQGRVMEWMVQAAEGMEPGGNVDDWAAALVARQRGAPTAARDRWMESCPRQVDALRACAASDRLTWVSGELAARTLASTRLAETWIHTVDVAVAFGPEPAATERLWPIARLAWRTLPYAVARAGLEPIGPVGFDLEAPDGGRWRFGMDPLPPTVVTGTARDLCTVAGQRARADETGLSAGGPHARAALSVVRTFA